MDDDGEGETFKLPYVIPFEYVGRSMYIQLANKLDPISPVSGNNWQMLAEKLGFTTNNIMVIESQQGRHTDILLREYHNTKGSTVNKLFQALDEIGRPDALDVLKEGYDEIEKNYLERQQRYRQKELIENEFKFSSSDNMSYSHDGYPLYGQGHSSYGMYHNSHPMAGLPGVGKNIHRHNSVDPQYMSSRYDHTSPEFKRQKSMPTSESMMVRGRDSHSMYIRDVEPMEMSPSLRDDPVPPALAMMRGMPHYNNMRNIPQLNTVIHSSKDQDSIFRQPCSGQYNLQRDRAGLKLEIPPRSEMFSRQRSGEFCSPNPTPTTPSTPLGQLQKLANERTFQPEDGYKDLMKMKREEELLQGKMEGADKMEFVSQQGAGTGTSMACNSGNHGEEGSQGSRSRAIGQPNTFPRLKSSGSCSTSSSSSPTSASQQLTKSASLPSNMKPAEFTKAFRHIKVFVTYSADDNKHLSRVLTLCDCLKKNGFNCCVDSFHRILPAEERQTWYQDRFEEADFILVVMSPKYKMEADSCEMDNDADHSESDDDGTDNRLDNQLNRLHTKNIYRLMYREYAQCGQKSVRFVPVIFKGVNEDSIPQWMLDANNRLFYYWPKQYKDLLWMLTKPENRVPEHVTPPVNRCPPDNGNHVTNHMTNNSSENNLETE